VRARGAAPALALVALAAGCGSSTGPAAAPRPETLTPPQYRQEADRSCAGFNDQVRRLPRPRRQTELGPLLHRIVGLEEATIRELAALDPPRALRSRHARFVSLSRRIYGIHERQLRVIDAGGRPFGVLRTDLRLQQRLTRRANLLARGLGLRQCAVTPQPRGEPGPSA
jgi:hypothetical protein